MADGRSRSDADRCFVCGTDNPIGLRVKFELKDGVCRGIFTPGEHHGGFDHVTHGGIIYSVLDDAMANWLFLQGARGYTARAEVRYRTRLDVGSPMVAECRLKKRKGRLVVLEAIGLQAADDMVVAQAEASFIVDEFGSLAD